MESANFCASQYSPPAQRFGDWPLITKTLQVEYITRKHVSRCEAIYAQIEADLTDAIAALPEKGCLYTNFRHRPGFKRLRQRVARQVVHAQKDYDNAEKYCLENHQYSGIQPVAEVCRQF